MRKLIALVLAVLGVCAHLQLAMAWGLWDDTTAVGASDGSVSAPRSQSTIQPAGLGIIVGGILWLAGCLSLILSSCSSVWGGLCSYLMLTPINFCTTLCFSFPTGMLTGGLCGMIGAVLSSCLSTLEACVVGGCSTLKSLLFSCCSWCTSFCPLALFDIMWEAVDTMLTSAQDLCVSVLSLCGTLCSMGLSFCGTFVSMMVSALGTLSSMIVSTIEACASCAAADFCAGIMDIADTLVACSVSSVESFAVFCLSALGTLSSMILSFLGTCASMILSAIGACLAGTCGFFTGCLGGVCGSVVGLISAFVVFCISALGTLVTECIDLLAGGIEAVLSLTEALLFSCISWCASFVPLAIFDILWEIIDTACASLQDFLVFCASFCGTAASMILSMIGTICSSLLGCCGWCSFDIIWETVDTIMASVQDFAVFCLSALGTLVSMLFTACEGSINGCWNFIDSCGTLSLAAVHALLGVMYGLVCGGLWGALSWGVAGCVLPFVFCTIIPCWNMLCGWWMSCPFSCAGGLCGCALGAVADALWGGVEGVVQ